MLGFIIHFSVNHFYVVNPYYNLHKLNFTFSFKGLLSSLTHLDLFFNDVTPIFWNSGFLIIIMFITVGAFLFKERKYKESLTVFISTLLIISTLGISKVSDGSNSIFFPLSRMYLSIPVLLGISLSFFSFKEKSKYFYFYLLIPLSFFIYNINTLDKSINLNVSHEKNHIIGVIKTNDLFEQCNNIKSICDEYNVQLVIISNHWNYDFFNYACPSCDETFPKTLRPSYERRTWRLIEDEKTIYSNILIIDLNKDFSKQFNFVKQIKPHNEYFIIENNSLYTIDLLDTLEIEYRKYK